MPDIVVIGNRRITPDEVRNWAEGECPKCAGSMTREHMYKNGKVIWQAPRNEMKCKECGFVGEKFQKRDIGEITSMIFGLSLLGVLMAAWLIAVPVIAYYEKGGGGYTMLGALAFVWGLPAVVIAFFAGPHLYFRWRDGPEPVPYVIRDAKLPTATTALLSQLENPDELPPGASSKKPTPAKKKVGMWERELDL